MTNETVFNFSVDSALLQELGEKLPPSGRRLETQARCTAPTTGCHSKEVETAMIRKAVDDARGNVKEAPVALGISRATVYRKLGAQRDRG